MNYRATCYHSTTTINKSNEISDLKKMHYATVIVRLQSTKAEKLNF